MSDVTEIYICKDGQKLKDGKLEYSGQVENKDEAEAEAKRRCNQDATIAKIAYYRVSPSGKFSNFFVYENPEAARRKSRGAAGPARAARARARKARKPDHSMWMRLRTIFEQS